MIYDILLVLILLSVIIGWIYVLFRWNKQVRWLFTPLIWLKDILDVQWWANLIGNKTGLFQRARNNRYRRWLETLPPRKKIAIELGVALPLMILMDHYILMPYLGVAMLPWNWDWSGG